MILHPGNPSLIQYSRLLTTYSNQKYFHQLLRRNKKKRETKKTVYSCHKQWKQENGTFSSVGQPSNLSGVICNLDYYRTRTLKVWGLTFFI